jgi:hypothetical protein
VMLVQCSCILLEQDNNIVLYYSLIGVILRRTYVGQEALAQVGYEHPDRS